MDRIFLLVGCFLGKNISLLKLIIKGLKVLENVVKNCADIKVSHIKYKLYSRTPDLRVS